MTPLQTIEAALGLSDIEQMGADIINCVLRDDECFSEQDGVDDRMQYRYKHNGAVTGLVQVDDDGADETTFTKAGKLLLIKEIEMRLQNIKLRIEQEDDNAV